MFLLPLISIITILIQKCLTATKKCYFSFLKLLRSKTTKLIIYKTDNKATVLSLNNRLMVAVPGVGLSLSKSSLGCHWNVILVARPCRENADIYVGRSEGRRPRKRW